MDKLRWIAIGILGGVLYARLVTLLFAWSFAIAWPEWYQVFAEDRLVLGVFLWNAAIKSPALLCALLIGLVLIRLLKKSALPAAFAGACAALVYVAVGSTGSDWVSVNTLIITGLLPFSVFMMDLFDKNGTS